MLDLSALPSFTKSQSAGLNSLRWLLGTLQPASTDGRIQIEDLTECPPAEFDAPFQIVLNCKYGTFILTFETACLEAMLDQLGVSWREEDEAAVPLEWWLTYLVDLFLAQTPLADAKVSNMSGDVAVPGGGGKAPALYGAMHCLGQAWAFAIVVLETVPGKPIPRPKLKATAEQEDLPITVDVYLDRIQLTLATVRSLVTGDLLLLRAAPDEDINAHLTLNRHMTWNGIVSDAGAFHVQSPTKETAAMDFDADFANDIADDDEKASGAEPAERADLSALPMHLDFQLCRKSLPLHQVSNLAPGTILELGIDLREPITIKVNDQPIGSGHMVKIGTRVGIQIAVWNDQIRLR